MRIKRRRNRVKTQHPLPMAVHNSLGDATIFVQDEIDVGHQLFPVRNCREGTDRTVEIERIRPDDSWTPRVKGVKPGPDHQQSFVSQYVGFDIHARSAHSRHASLSTRCRIHDGNDGPDDSRIEQRLMAWRRSTVVVAGFERDDGCPALRPCTGGTERQDLRVRLALALVVAFANDPSFHIENHASNWRVRARASYSEP